MACFISTDSRTAPFRTFQKLSGNWAANLCNLFWHNTKPSPIPYYIFGLNKTSPIQNRLEPTDETTTLGRFQILFNHTTDYTSHLWIYRKKLVIFKDVSGLGFEAFAPKRLRFFSTSYHCLIYLYIVILTNIFPRSSFCQWQI